MKKVFALMLTMVFVLSLLLVGCGSNETEDASGEENSITTEQKEDKKEEKKEDKKEEPTEDPNPASTRANAADTLVVGMPAPKGEALPVYYSTTYDGYTCGIIFDGLLSVDESGQFIPDVAESYELSEDNLTYTFKLKDNINFTNGEPLTANDVKFTYEILADPSYDGRYFSVVEFMEGVEAYKNGEADDVTGIKVLDEYTVSFTFTEPRFDNISNMTTQIMPESVYAYEYGNTQQLRDQMNAYEWVGSGPYKIVHFEPTQFIEFERNDDYHLGAPKMEKLIYKMTTVDTQMAELEKGDLDILLNVAPTPENFGVVDRLDYVMPHTFPSNGYGYMGFNMRDEILSDMKVRQALTYAFDRRAFVQKYYDGHSIVLDVPFSEVSYANTESLKSKVNPYTYDKEKAVALLEEAGWKTGDDGYRYKDGKKLELKWLTYTDSRYVETLIPMLTAYWKEVGVELIAEQMEFNTLVEKVYLERDFQLYNMAWSLTNLPTSNYTTFHSSVDVPDGNNSVGYRNARNDELLDMASTEFDLDKQIEIFEEWALLFNEELPYILINNNEELECVNGRVENYTTSPFVDIDMIIHDIAVK
ncbi:ABC transporter substrate-binding protein [Vallitalea okinawensis]|uniref:ABC transporter substrate-binding protein n=1 Tax=Vallitalea okinawensis TaxID=2078660 RepID=UPI000CFBF3DA|nr:ABC transporter substrate-binding protein [Vallitalea okinawensis]